MVRPCSTLPASQTGKGAPKTKEHAMSQKLNSTIAVIGIDIGKNSFHIVGQDLGHQKIPFVYEIAPRSGDPACSSRGKPSRSRLPYSLMAAVDH
jgi:hypothetical protein